MDPVLSIALFESPLPPYQCNSVTCDALCSSCSVEHYFTPFTCTPSGPYFLTYRCTSRCSFGKCILTRTEGCSDSEDFIDLSHFRALDNRIPSSYCCPKMPGGRSYPSHYFMERMLSHSMLAYDKPERRPLDGTTILDEDARKYIALDYCLGTGGMLVVANRGTVGLRDLGADIQAIPSSMDQRGQWAHYGMKKRATAVLKWLQHYAHWIREVGSIVFTGHSLGAGTSAILVAMHHLSEFYQFPSGIQQVYGVGFATPPVLDENIVNFTSFIFRSDLVTRLCFLSALDYCKQCDNNNTLVIWSTLAHPICFLVKLVNLVWSTEVVFKVPGTVMYSDGTGPFAISSADKFLHIVSSRTMHCDHSLDNGYKKVLLNEPYVFPCNEEDIEHCPVRHSFLSIGGFLNGVVSYARLAEHRIPLRTLAKRQLYQKTQLVVTSSFNIFATDPILLSGGISVVTANSTDDWGNSALIDMYDPLVALAYSRVWDLLVMVDGMQAVHVFETNAVLVANWNVSTNKTSHIIAAAIDDRTMEVILLDSNGSCLWYDMTTFELLREVNDDVFRNASSFDTFSTTKRTYLVVVSNNGAHYILDVMNEVNVVANWTANGFFYSALISTAATSFDDQFVVYSVDGTSERALAFAATEGPDGNITEIQQSLVSFPNITTPISAISVVDYNGIFCAIFTNESVLLVECPLPIVPSYNFTNSTDVTDDTDVTDVTDVTEGTSGTFATTDTTTASQMTVVSSTSLLQFHFSKVFGLLLVVVMHFLLN